MYENYYDIDKKAMRLGLMSKTRTLLVDHTLAHFFVVLLQPQHETPLECEILWAEIFPFLIKIGCSFCQFN